MNNTLNKIVGIGIINNIIQNASPRISDDKYNGVYYASPFHLKVDYSLSNEELNFIHYEFERSVFYGKSNLKRGQNLCKYPDERIKYKHLMFLLKLYASKNPSNVVDKILMKNEQLSMYAKTYMRKYINPILILYYVVSACSWLLLPDRTFARLHKSNTHPDTKIILFVVFLIHRDFQ